MDLDINLVEKGAREKTDVMVRKETIMGTIGIEGKLSK